MIGDIFHGWRHETAELLRTDLRGTEYAAVDVAAAADRATEILDVDSPVDGRDVVPLFGEDDPVATNQYVLYRPDEGHVGWYDSGFGVSGTERFTAAENLETTAIGQRLRFWLPEHRPTPDLAYEESELPADPARPTGRSSDAERREFFDEMREFVRTERDAERTRNRERYAELGLDAAIRRNRVTGPFLHLHRGYTDDGRSGFTYQLASDGDDEVDLRGDEGVFEGNHCLVDSRNGDEHLPVEAEVLSVDGPTVTLLPRWETVEHRTVVDEHLRGGGTDVWLHELLNPVPYRRRLAAIDQVQRDPEKRDLLAGTRPLEFTVNRYVLPESAIDLNEYQRLAVLWAESARDLVCLHGPPGTGKTRTLTAYVERAVSRGQSVLVTAHSNQAVDNLLVGDSTRDSPEADTLHAMAQDRDTDLSIARVGSNSRNRVVRERYLNRPVSESDVVAATTSGASRFGPDSFDVAVVDEATQASRPATAIVLNCARKLVLAGDHRQLPPYCADESMQEEALHVSLFEHLLDRYGDDVSVLLRKQYRMNEAIAAFPNEAFYDGDLETAGTCREWTVDDLDPLVGVDVVGEERRPTHGTSLYNEREADAVANQVERLLESGLDPDDVGVISAYRGQIGRIRGRVDRLDARNTGRVTVDTVDSFQGGEREAIVVSFVRSNADGDSGFLTFPDEGPRRLNVALTRARKRLVLVGDWNTLGTVAPNRSAGESCAHLYAALARHVRSNGRMTSPSKTVTQLD